MRNKPHVWNEYHDMMTTEFFNVCADKRVIEIAPMAGHQTQSIVKHTLKSLTLIEADKKFESELIDQFPSATVICDDIFKVYEDTISADVVVSCGLLYHLHNPFHLLELIVNQSDPEYIILDSIHPRDKLRISVDVEQSNTIGNRTSKENWKCVNYNVVVDFEYVNSALIDLGYVCLKNINLRKFMVETKLNSWMALWKKTNQNEQIAIANINQ